MPRSGQRAGRGSGRGAGPVDPAQRMRSALTPAQLAALRGPQSGRVVDAARLVLAMLAGDREAMTRMVAAPTRSRLLGAATLCAFLGQAVHGDQLPGVLRSLIEVIEGPGERPDPPAGG